MNYYERLFANTVALFSGAPDQEKDLHLITEGPADDSSGSDGDRKRILAARARKRGPKPPLGIGRVTQSGKRIYESDVGKATESDSDGEEPPPKHPIRCSRRKSSTPIWPLYSSDEDIHFY